MAAVSVVAGTWTSVPLHGQSVTITNPSASCIYVQAMQGGVPVSCLKLQPAGQSGDTGTITFPPGSSAKAISGVDTTLTVV